METMTAPNERQQFDERQQFHVADAEAWSDKEPQAAAFSPDRIEMLKDLTLTLLKEVESLEVSTAFQEHREERRLCLYDEVRRFEIKMISRALLRTGGHQARAAQLLGVKPTTLNAKMKRYRLDPEHLLDGGNDVEASFESTNETD